MDGATKVHLVQSSCGRLGTLRYYGSKPRDHRRGLGDALEKEKLSIKIYLELSEHTCLFSVTLLEGWSPKGAEWPGCNTG